MYIYKGLFKSCCNGIQSHLYSLWDAGIYETEFTSVQLLIKKKKTRKKGISSSNHVSHVISPQPQFFKCHCLVIESFQNSLFGSFIPKAPVPTDCQTFFITLLKKKVWLWTLTKLKVFLFFVISLKGFSFSYSLKTYHMKRIKFHDGKCLRYQHCSKHEISECIWICRLINK